MTDTEDPNIATLREALGKLDPFPVLNGEAYERHELVHTASVALSALASTLAERDRRIAALEANEAEWRDLAEGLSDSLAAANAPAPDARRKRTNHVAVLHAFITSHFALNSFPAIAAALRALDAAEKCEECDGSGERYDDEDNPRPCIDCSGTGRIEAEHLRAPKGELEEARAELGAWFLSNPGWSACYLVNSAGVQIGLQHYAGAQWWGGFKPTEAAAIRAALSRARGEGA